MFLFAVFFSLELQGITAKSDIGFLTLLEHLRYCEVRICIVFLYECLCNFDKYLLLVRRPAVEIIAQMI